MKKKNLAIVLAVAGFFAVSCKKNYTCDCSGTYKEEWVDKDTGEKDDFFSSESSISYSETIKDKKKDAEAKCSGYEENTNATSEAAGYTITQTQTVSCTLTKK